MKNGLRSFWSSRYITFSQFHQHFTRSFFANIISKKMLKAKLWLEETAKNTFVQKKRLLNVYEMDHLLLKFQEKKRIARKKERRATLILGLIMGSFIACWFPFFFLYSISPVCPICEDNPTSPCCVMQWGFSFAFWLGYSNSALNPVIYTIFNKDFRQAFKRILFR